MNSTLIIALVTVVSISGAPALAGQPFDGSWSVKIVTQTPDARCKGRSVALRVQEGNVKYAGFLGGLVSGKVNSKGKLNAQIARVKVSGNLLEDAGSGAWRSPNCKGTWTASRS